MKYKSLLFISIFLFCSCSPKVTGLRVHSEFSDKIPAGSVFTVGDVSSTFGKKLQGHEWEKLRGILENTIKNKRGYTVTSRQFMEKSMATGEFHEIISRYSHDRVLRGSDLSALSLVSGNTRYLVMALIKSDTIKKSYDTRRYKSGGSSDYKKGIVLPNDSDYNVDHMYSTRRTILVNYKIYDLDLHAEVWNGTTSAFKTRTNVRTDTYGSFMRWRNHEAENIEKYGHRYPGATPLSELFKKASGHFEKNLPKP